MRAARDARELLPARLTYLPDAGFTGADSLTYVATDGRGLRSAPVTVTIEVAPAPPAAEPVTLHAPPLLRRLLRIDGARRTGARRLAVRLRCLDVASRRCTGMLEARIASRRAGRTRFAVRAGRRRTVALHLRRSAGRRLVRLRATGVRDALGPTRDARRTTRPR